MCEYGLWDLVHDLAYKKNVDDEVIDESEEHVLNIDNTHLFGYSTPGKYVKECRECELYEDCEDKVSTDATADWYIKGKYQSRSNARLRGLKGTLSLIFFELPHKSGISIERVMLGEQEIRFCLEQNCLCFEEEIQIVQRQSLLVRFK